MALNYTKNLSSNIQVLDTLEDDNKYIFTIRSNNRNATCPHCGKLSTSVHQRSKRVIQDLPLNKKDVNLDLRVRVFACKNSNCEQFSFSEEFDFVRPSEKKTNRLINLIVEASKNKTCREATRILNDEGIKISKTTVNDTYKKYQ